ncbi:hypothetical protein VF14_11680 [Nostoc linckia z18]|uniref:Transcription regulator PadR N-terminal domain-containing protein n=2 Tax=Nostoc linckia TaxID=92942 RepID=A0A9Q5ZA41_NOSLI|nr:helix-turn-helix transcriptional regulator [Nostoc linckia]PHK40885.1 hypothetical protein VF12_08570 [Nostoc linckia z15]PHK46428.1 hypothetical protein VF13_10805 [Nostoc linckia z16]PHJ60228.1 hypothetical protein VF02_22960 [Nostoc linckia z1]PHJ63793.1 hypothetical protein VF05_23920 [Nostoc linckia z3]PHJ70807.1 hypothetical protein VF03_21490 [Nostoc linckia z2]
MAKYKTNEVIVLSALEEDLLTVLMGKGEQYGLKILEIVNQARQLYKIPELKIGSLYPTLQRMEKQNLIVSQQLECRRYYSITAYGRDALTSTNAYRKQLAEYSGDLI